MYGVWFAGFMKCQPSTITRITIVTLVITMVLFTQADCCVPRISSSESSARMKIDGTFMIPVMLVPCMCSNGECDHWYGTAGPKKPRTLLKYSLHAMATVAAPTAYSRIRSQPMIHATSSPIVTYEYVYALPAIGIIEANSA